MADEVDYDRIEDIALRVANKANTTRMSQIAKESSKEAVTEILLVCGIDATNPLEMQKLMAYGKECQGNAERTKKAIDWVHDVMDTGKIFKKSLINELGKHVASGMVILGAVWVFIYGGK